MNKQKNYFNTILSKNKFKSFGFFLLLAFVFLIFTKLSKKYTETLNLKLELVNVPDDIYINQDSILPISATVSTFGFNYLIHLLKPQNISLDFKTVFSVDGNYAYSASSNIKYLITQKLGSNTVIETVKPDSITIPFSKLISKVVPIKLNRQFSFMPGYNLYDSIVMKPDSVKIIGSSIAVDNVDFIETSVISLKEIKSNINVKADLKLNEGSNVKLSKVHINVTAEVEKYTENIVFIPIDIMGLPKGVKINYFPKTVDVLYEVALKDAARIIPEMFEVVCDFNQVTNKNLTTLKPILYKSPDVVRNPRIKLNEVEFIIIE